MAALFFLLSSTLASSSNSTASRFFFIFEYTIVTLFLGALSLALGIFLIVSSRKALRLCFALAGFLGAGSLGLAINSAPHHAFVSLPMMLGFGLVGGALAYAIWRVVMVVVAAISGYGLASYLLTTPLGDKVQVYLNPDNFQLILTSSALWSSIIFNDLLVTLLSIILGSILTVIGVRFITLAMVWQGHLDSIDPSYFDIMAIVKTAGLTGSVQVAMRIFRRIRYGPRTL